MTSFKPLEKYLKKYSVKTIFNFQHKNCPFAAQSKFFTDYFQQRGYKILEINGDAVDKKAMNEGQLMTRLQAFQESVVVSL